MEKVIVYTMRYCPYCESAKRLLQSKGIAYEEVLVKDDDDAVWARLEKETGYKTMPQIFVGKKFIGGYSELARLDSTGELSRLVSGG